MMTEIFLVPDKKELAELALKIDVEHNAALGHAKKAVERAAECGRLLIEAKRRVAHSEWLSWLKANTLVGERQSQKYMRIARVTADGKYDLGTHSTIQSLLDLLAVPREHAVATEPREHAVATEPREPTRGGMREITVQSSVVDFLPRPDETALEEAQRRIDDVIYQGQIVRALLMYMDKCQPEDLVEAMEVSGTAADELEALIAFLADVACALARCEQK